MYYFSLGLIILIGIYIVFNELYIKLRAGKLILKINETRGFAISLIFMFIIWILLIIFECRSYILYKNTPMEYEFFKSEILSNVYALELIIMYILNSIRCSEIRENGICYFNNFVRWKRIKDWKWTDENTIQFRFSLFFKLSYKVKLSVSKYSKWSMDETLEKYVKKPINKKQKIKFKEN